MGIVYAMQDQKPAASAIMSDLAIDDLPVFAQVIILHTRDLEDLCSQPVVCFQEARKSLERKKFLANSAHRQWQNVDGSPPPPRRRR